MPSGDWTPYVFTSAVGTPLKPRTLTRTFHALCARHGFDKATHMISVTAVSASCWLWELIHGLSWRSSALSYRDDHERLWPCNVGQQRAVLDLLSNQLSTDEDQE